MTCRGICAKFKTKIIVNKRRYENAKRCSHCDIFISFLGLRCPCCGYRLKSKPRNSKNKKKYLQVAL